MEACGYIIEYCFTNTIPWPKNQVQSESYSSDRWIYRLWHCLQIILLWSNLYWRNLVVCYLKRMDILGISWLQILSLFGSCLKYCKVDFSILYCWNPAPLTDIGCECNSCLRRRETEYPVKVVIVTIIASFCTPYWEAVIAILDKVNLRGLFLCAVFFWK